MADYINKAHLLSINKTRAYIDKNSPSLEELTSNLPAVKEDTITNKKLARESTRTRDKDLIGTRSKWS